MSQDIKIIQNALYLKSQDIYIQSNGVHDFVRYKIGKFEGFIDGGREYLRRVEVPANLLGDIIDYCLTTESHPEEIKDKLLWGTYGKNGKAALKYLPIRLLETDHLEAILKNVKTINKLHKKVIKDTLKDRK